MATLNKESAYKVLLKVDPKCDKIGCVNKFGPEKCGEFDVGESVGKKCLGKMAKRVNSNIN